MKYSKNRAKSTFSSGPYFNFPTFASIINKVWIQSKINSFKLLDLKKYLNAVSNPKSIIDFPIKASSEDPSQDISCTILYDDGSYWSSEGSENYNINEYLIYKLKSKSFVFSVHFKVYRALFQDGIVYSPKKVKVKIGNSLNDYHYESEEFDVGLTERYNTILILPNFIEGEYARIDLIGKQMREPFSEDFYTMISFVDIIGFPIEKLNSVYVINEENDLDIEDIIKYKNFNDLSDPKFARTPFLYERVLKSGKISNLLIKSSERIYNEIETYLLKVNRPSCFNDSQYYEICAQHFYDKGKFDIARQMFLGCKDYWGVCNCLIILGNYGLLKDFARDNSRRRPQFDDIIKFAKELGSDYEAKVIENII